MPIDAGWESLVRMEKYIKRTRKRTGLTAVRGIDQGIHKA
jgi:hypothetical protein